VFSRKCLRKERRPSSENRLYVFTSIKMMIGPQLIFNQIFSFENMGFFVTLEKNKAVCNLKIFRVGTGKNVGYHICKLKQKIRYLPGKN
jgi:hypothetical protein